MNTDEKKTEILNFETSITVCDEVARG